MTILHSLSDWLAFKQATTPSIANLPVVKMGDDGDLSPPFLGLMESGSALIEQNGVTMYGWTAYEITAELHSVPAPQDEGGTPETDERIMRDALDGIIRNRDAIPWMDGRNDFQVVDIRSAGPTTEAGDGIRITRWNLTIISAPI